VHHELREVPATAMPASSSSSLPLTRHPIRCPRRRFTAALPPPTSLLVNLVPLQTSQSSLCSSSLRELTVAVVLCIGNTFELSLAHSPSLSLSLSLYLSTPCLFPPRYHGFLLLFHSSTLEQRDNYFTSSPPITFILSILAFYSRSFSISLPPHFLSLLSHRFSTVEVRNFTLLLSFSDYVLLFLHRFFLPLVSFLPLLSDGSSTREACFSLA
jgi:hypothetical protein